MMVLCFGISLVVYMQCIVATNMISDHIRKYYFVSSMDDVEVLGWYEDVAGQPPAILRANHGKGYAVLSGRRCFYLTRWTAYRFSIICLKCA